MLEFIGTTFEVKGKKLNVTAAMRKNAAEMLGALVYAEPEVVKRRQDALLWATENHGAGNKYKVPLLAYAGYWEFRRRCKRDMKPRAGMLDNYARSLVALPRADDILDSIERRL